MDSFEVEQVLRDVLKAILIFPLIVESLGFKADGRKGADSLDEIAALKAENARLKSALLQLVRAIRDKPEFWNKEDEGS